MSVDFIPTIEDDEDVEREESDSEEEVRQRMLSLDLP